MVDRTHVADRESIRALREEHIGRLLLDAHRSFSGRAVAKLRARGHAGLGLAHMALLPHLDLDGTRVTTLAERAGMTKQGMGQLVSDLAGLGYVARASDPADRRATLVTFTEAGWRFLRDAHEIKREMEAEYAALLGPERLEALRTTLAVLLGRDDQASTEELAADEPAREREA